VLAWSLATLATAPSVRSIVVVFNTDNVARGNALIRRLGLAHVVMTCLGGTRRQDSVLNGVRTAVGMSWVAIHDAARPFVSVELVERGVRAARDVGAAIAAVPVKDTIKRVDSEHLIESTPKRADLWAAQTPQIFQWEQLMLASQANGDADVTDEAELLERAGFPVAVYPGSYDNIKITTAEDLTLARAIARQRQQPAVTIA
jgi:2-C-methyl-D-erythritol 4-phosphate cytidylyltransferase